LSEVLARTRHDSVLSGSAEGTLRNRAHLARAWLSGLRSALPTRADGYARIALALAMTVVVVNALILQHESHPAPFFAEGRPIPSATSTKPPAEHVAPISASENALPPRASPPMRPPESGSRPEPNPSSRSIDPIAEMLHSEANKDAQRLLTAAQTALTKLGYSIKTGAAGGSDTIAALRDFEKAHGLPLSTDVTPRLVKLLSAAVNSSSFR
jgi:hypothetical protein